MNRMKTKRLFSWMIIFFMTLLVVTLLAVSCSEENSAENAAVEPAHLQVRLTDAPAQYEEVIVDIQDVQVNNSDDDEGWISLDVNEGQYDLLELTNGLDTLLGTTDLPAGKISQIRLILGTNNSIRVKGIVYELKTPSAQQSGLKVKVDTELEAGKSYTILLDFDAARSIVKRGKHDFNLKPVIRATAQVTGETNEEKGSIEGIVTPANSESVIYAIMGIDSVSTSADGLGMFAIMNLDTGMYHLLVVPSDSTYKQLAVDSVHVSAGEVTDVGNLLLEEN